MTYVAKHKKSCKNQSRYVVVKRVFEIQNRIGSTISNNDPGIIMYMRCANCLAPAKWQDGR